MGTKSLKLIFVLFLACIAFSLAAGFAAAAEGDAVLMEGELTAIQDGYYLNVVEIDTYSETVRFAIYYYDTLMLDQYYYRGDYVYYQDYSLTLEFKVNDVYSDSYYDYVLISDVYLYPDYTVTSDGGQTDYYSDYDYSDTSAEDEFYGMIFLLFIVLVVIWIIRKIGKRGKKKQIADKPEKQVMVSSVPSNEKAPDAEMVAAQTSAKTEPVVIKSAIQYKGANILYKIKVENISDEPMGDISIGLFVPDVFLLKEDHKNISMLQPGEGKTVTFHIRPTGECGNCIIAGNIRYYEYSLKKHLQFDLSNKMVDIVCPVLNVKEMDEAGWRQNISSMMLAEEDTKDLEIPAENLFDIATRILKDMNMFMITPEVTSTQQLFTGVARFYAEGVAGLKYAAYIEVVGKRKSRLIVKSWAEKEEALTGFYHKILEEIEKRTDIKLFVDDSVTQYTISNTTTIQDSVIQRSHIGGGKRKCSQCGREVEGSERFCINCGQKLD